MLRVVAGTLIAFALASGTAFPLVGAMPADHSKPIFAEREVLVKLKPFPGFLAESGFRDAYPEMTLVKRYRSVDNLLLIELPPGETVSQAIRRLSKDPSVEYAEPNYVVHPTAPAPPPSHALRPELVPDDVHFAALWGLDNTGQTGGTPDADIDAAEAWDLSTGDEELVVALLDTGIDYTHPDLAPNAFQNAPECAGTPGVDDDGNGFVDDCVGIDTFSDDGDPLDTDGHGTHVAGILGAAGDNALGVAGVAFRVQILPCRFLGPGGGTIADAIDCLDYVLLMKQRGVNVVASNNSWGGGGFSQALKDAIAAQMDAGLLFFAAAGNGGGDNDLVPFYPANYFVPNVVSVAATDHDDRKAPFSQFGAHTVHLGAPGVSVLSTVDGGDFSFLSGTSMATAYASGTAVLLKAHDRARDWRALKNLMLAGGDTLPALAETITGRRLNAFQALQCQNRTLFRLLRPQQDQLAVPAGSTLTFQALNLRCGQAAGTVTVDVNAGAQTVALRDDGQGADLAAGDGLYAGTWTVPEGGPFALGFPDGSTLTVNAPATAYHVRAEAFSWREIQGAPLGFGDDGERTVVPPFPLRFAASQFSHVRVSSNGALSFEVAPFVPFQNASLPNGNFQTLVAPFWDDLIFFGDGDAFWEVVGSAPRRELVIEWRHARHFPSCAGAIRFQVVLSESSDDLLFNYRDVHFGDDCATFDRGGSATVGVQVSPSAATTFSENAPALDDELTLRWTLQGKARCDVQRDQDRDLFDLNELAGFLIGQKSLSAAQRANADANRDGQIDLQDIAHCARFLTGAIRTLGTKPQARAPDEAAPIALTWPKALTLTPGERATVRLRAGAPLAGLQVGPAGRLRFDPAVIQVREVRGLNGHRVLAAAIDPVRGEVRFVAASLRGQVSGAPVELTVEAVGEPGARSPLDLRPDLALDRRGQPVQLAVEAGRVALGQRVPLAVRGAFAARRARGVEFKVQGQGVRALAVTVFDLAGRRVFHGRADGTALRWSLRDARGRPAANGVYLYAVVVEGVNGERLTLPIRKLAVLR